MVLSWQQMRVVIAKVFWSFDVERVSKHKDLQYEADFKLYGMLEKPDFWVRFRPVAR
jgi:hypothetical protein